ncbi:glycosyltransferase family 4 protein [Psychroserpens sp. AS72]|uniref:glycosyltransferase family 4 protein n=1 Tax=Psychroserpens sp. AS72 TaxID=3135775 RepID=UPI00317079E0
MSEFYQELSDRLSKDNFEVFNFYLKHKKAYFNQGDVTVYGEKRGGFFSKHYHIYKIIKKVRPDVIISNFSYINPAVLFGRLLGVSHNIAWFHTAFGHTKPNLLKIKNKTFYLNRANVVIANSKQLEKEIHTVYKVPKKRTISIPFWTNISNYRSNSEISKIEYDFKGLSIGCPGRLVEDKNHKLAIEALYQLKKNSNQPVKLFIAGNGSYKPQLKQLVNSLNLEKDVVFLGLLNVSEMISFYDCMDVIVLPSFHEAFGLVFIEAIALGRPVLVSKSFGSLGFIDSQKFSIDDISFNPHSVKELVSKLSMYIDEKGKQSDYFKIMYERSFEKDIIYNQVKAVILNQN